MQALTILLPMSALVIWTLLVLLLIPYRRFRAAFRKQVSPEDFRYGESAAVPEEVRIPNRNFMNLLELPVLFYLLCLTLLITQRVDQWALGLAWIYVALRIVHSLIHLSYNRVTHRLTVYGLSNFVLSAMWLRFVVWLIPAALA